MTVALHRHFIERVQRQPSVIRAAVFETVLALPDAFPSRVSMQVWVVQAAPERRMGSMEIERDFKKSPPPRPNPT